jgi:hypothetical protein
MDNNVSWAKNQEKKVAWEGYFAKIACQKENLPFVVAS